MTITLAVTPPEARLFVDGVVVSTNPFRATMPRDTQSHKVGAALPGFVTEERFVVFDHDMELQLALAPVPVGADAAAPDRRPHRSDGVARPAPNPRETSSPQPTASPTPGEALTGAAQKKPRPIDETF